MNTLINGLSWLLLAAGSLFVITGAVGLLRMPDFYTRLHPAGVTDSMGLPLILVGLILQSGFSLISLKIFLLILFMLLTSPTACHALARAALLSHVKPLGRLHKEASEKYAGGRYDRTAD